MTMTKSSFAPGLAVAMVAGLLFSPIAAIEGAVAEPAEVTVLTSVALTSALDELAPQFESYVAQLRLSAIFAQMIQFLFCF